MSTVNNNSIKRLNGNKHEDICDKAVIQIALSCTTQAHAAQTEIHEFIYLNEQVHHSGTGCTLHRQAKHSLEIEFTRFFSSSNVCGLFMFCLNWRL